MHMLFKISLTCLLLICLAGSHTYAQQNWFVYFADKEATALEAEDYLSPYRYELQQRQGLPLTDEYDLPVNESYVDQVEAQTDSLRYTLRWLNAVTVRATQNQIEAISQLPFVRSVQAFSQQSILAKDTLPKNYSAQKLDTLLYQQRKLMQLPVIEQKGYTGQGVRVAIFDAGFKEVNKHPALKQVRDNNQILFTKDFYKNRKTVYYHSRHGMEVMSCVAGLYKGKQIGCAKGASFLLARTEHKFREKPVEEDHWIAAAEWAYVNGAQIINSSMTYTADRYSYEDMTGRVSPVSLAASIAANKGILVINSMGNLGDQEWKYLGAPADAPEVLSIGGSMPMLKLPIQFTSLGPNANNVRKPNVSAPGYVLTARKKGKFNINAGTSFAAPLIAGFAACLMEKFPDRPAQEIYKMIELSGHLFPYYDYALGFGVPDARRIFGDNIADPMVSFEPEFRQDTVVLKFNPEIMSLDTVDRPAGKELYYHFENDEGHLDAYQTELIPHDSEAWYFLWRPQAKGILRVWFEDYLFEQKNDP